ncbi:hypothetical protein [Aeromonas hydrophila]|uniref:hypothetical protein n=1 Tax=Aeromonas hydrophila TaxID=644 RepID=UPI003EC64467
MHRFIYAAFIILSSKMLHATTSPLTPEVVGHKPEFSPSYQGRLLVGDTVKFISGYKDVDNDLPSPEMRYKYYLSTQEGQFISALQDSTSPSLLLTPLLSGGYIAVKTKPLSLSGVPVAGDEITYVFPNSIGPLQGVTSLGTGLSVGNDGGRCILDGSWTTEYSSDCILYRLGDKNFGWVANKRFFEVSYDSSFAAKKFIFRGYWRQSKPGSLGIWAVYGCHDITCSDPRKITESKAISFVGVESVENGELRVVEVRPYYRYRFVYEGGVVDANGGKGYGSFNEIEIE